MVGKGIWAQNAAYPTPNFYIRNCENKLKRMKFLIPVSKEEAIFIRSKFPHKKVYDMYTGDRHVEKMVRRTKNHYWCTELSEIMKQLDEYRKNKTY